MKLTELKGIGAKTEELFIKAGVNDVMDLLLLFPRDYEEFVHPALIGDAGYRSFATIKGAFTQSVYERKGKNTCVSQSVFKDEAGDSVRTFWFNTPFIKNSVKPGVPCIIRGRVSRKYNAVQIDQPKIYSLAEYDMLEGNLQPVYSLTKGLSNGMVIKAMKQALETPDFFILDVEDIIPGSIRKKYGLCRRCTAVKNLHFPESREAYQKAAGRMAFEEIFAFIYSMRVSGADKKKPSEKIVSASEKIKEFISSLPYRLTDAQEKVIDEIEKDMASGFVMNRLIQGDVGSGKTIVAVCALMNAAYSGYQGAMMAPTEVLAEQHYKSITDMFEKHGIRLHAALLTGSMTAKEKRSVYDRLEDGSIDIIIGTHTLFQEKAKYRNLGLVITDEQHRFGIKQREALALKAGEAMPHMLVMSATPIPRTLALIIYGDMDVSVIDKAPASRKPIKNAVVDPSFRENAYRFITKQVAAGHQAYIICPLVEYSDGVDAANVDDYTEMLKGILDPSVRIEKLTGPMPPAQKNEIMQKFSDGQIDVLVSTTVVEVGVDVPNATVMMIEDANRFGLAALHQLRGRVGRGRDQSYCIFVSNNKSPEAMERLGILNSSNNGFEIAAKDLEMRGPGEFLGVRQSGELSFSYFDVSRDAGLALSAVEAVEAVLNGKAEMSDDERKNLNDKCGDIKGSILL